MAISSKIAGSLEEEVDMKVALFVLACVVCTIASVFQMGLAIEELHHPHSGGMPDGNTPLIFVGAILVPGFILHLIGEKLFGEGTISQLLDTLITKSPILLTFIVTALIIAAYCQSACWAASFLHRRKEVKS